MTSREVLRGVLAGALTAAACAVAWAGITFSTHMELGIIASLIGYAVGKAVYTGAGKRRGPVLQVVAMVLSVVGYLAGKFALLSMYIREDLMRDGEPATLQRIFTALQTALQIAPRALFGVFDFVWIAIAAYAAWRLLRLPQITIAGPYAYQAAGGGDLQFQTVEPAQTPDAPGPPTASGSK